jgi:hypothetical protein
MEQSTDGAGIVFREPPVMFGVFAKSLRKVL